MTDRPRILVVDDDDQIRSLIVDVLELEGYETRGAADGRAALATAQGWRPDLIVLDLMMPGMDGWAFRAEQRHRADIAAIPVLIVSATRHLEQRTQSLAPAAVIAKPFDIDRLVEIVQRLLAQA